MKEIRVGLIGLGFMGTTHLDIYRQHPKARLTAIADADPVKQQGELGGVTGNLGDGTQAPLDVDQLNVYASGLDLIRDPSVDLIDICTPVTTHRDLAIAALKAGKHVLIEKPLARTVEEAQEIADVAQNSPGKVLVGQCIRFWPEYRHAAEVITSGEAGSVKVATFKRVSPNIDGNGWENWFMNADLSGGALLDLHLHDVDYVRELLGMPEAISAFGARSVRSDGGIDHVLARFDYGDGSLITLEGGWSPAKGTPFEMGFQIVCDHMTLRLGAEGYQILHEDGRVETPDLSHLPGPTGWHAEIDHLLNCIQMESPSAMDIEGVVDSLKLIEAEAQSIETQTSTLLNAQP